MKELRALRARISFKAGLFLTMLGFLFTLGGAVLVTIMGVPAVSDYLITMTLGDEVRRAFFLSSSIATVIIGLLLFYIGYDKIKQKQMMEILSRDADRPAPVRWPPE